MKDEIINILLGSIPVSYDHTKPAREYIKEATDQILTLLDKEIQKARIELANNLKSIEYPPSGKEWHFNDGTWTNNITELGGVNE